MEAPPLLPVELLEKCCTHATAHDCLRFAISSYEANTIAINAVQNMFLSIESAAQLHTHMVLTQKHIQEKLESPLGKKNKWTMSAVLTRYLQAVTSKLQAYYTTFDLRIPVTNSTTQGALVYSVSVSPHHTQSLNCFLLNIELRHSHYTRPYQQHIVKADCYMALFTEFVLHTYPLGVLELPAQVWLHANLLQHSYANVKKWTIDGLYEKVAEQKKDISRSSIAVFVLQHSFMAADTKRPVLTVTPSLPAHQIRAFNLGVMANDMFCTTKSTLQQTFNVSTTAKFNIVLPWCTTIDNMVYYAVYVNHTFKFLHYNCEAVLVLQRRKGAPPPSYKCMFDKVCKAIAMTETFTLPFVDNTTFIIPHVHLSEMSQIQDSWCGSGGASARGIQNTHTQIVLYKKELQRCIEMQK